MTGKPGSAPRVAALVGPYLVGKTTLLESLLVAAGAISRKGSVKESAPSAMPPRRPAAGR